MHNWTAQDEDVRAPGDSGSVGLHGRYGATATLPPEWRQLVVSERALDTAPVQSDAAWPPPPVGEVAHHGSMSLDRDVAHVLLDLMSAHSDDAPDAVNVMASQTAFERLNDIGAVTLTWDDETDEPPHLNVTPLLTATGFLLRTLLIYAAEKSGKDDVDVVAALRKAVDEHLDQ